MPRIAKPLTDMVIRNARPKTNKEGKPIESMLFDGACPGLHLHVAKLTGRKTWRVRIYGADGKIEATLKIGVFDLVAKPPGHLELTQARDAARIVLQKPEVAVAKTKGIERSNKPESFRDVAEAWYSWKSLFVVNGKLPEPATLKKHRQCLDFDLLKEPLASTHIDDVDRDLVKDVLFKINARSNSVAWKCKQVFSMVMDYAVEEKYRSIPAPSFKRIIGEQKPAQFQMPADIRAEFQKYLNRKMRIAQLGIRLQHHTFLRSGETVEGGKWTEVDFDNRQWNIPTERMKEPRPHIVPMSNQVFDILSEIKELAGDSEYIFPTPYKSDDTDKSRCRDWLSDNFREAGIPYTPHECRDIANEWLKSNGIAPYIVETQLAHKLAILVAPDVQDRYESNPHKYYMSGRREAMQKWSDFLEPPKS